MGTLLINVQEFQKELIKHSNKFDFTSLSYSRLQRWNYFVSAAVPRVN